MGWPQVTIIVFSSLGIGLALAKHGERRIGKFNVWISMVSAAIEMGVLYAGGFFN